MSEANGASTPKSGDSPVSRRAALFELAGIAIVLAVSIGAAIATAHPIPNPPSRKTLDFAPLVNPAAEQQQREAEREQRRATKNERDTSEATTDSADEEQRPRATERRAAQP